MKCSLSKFLIVFLLLNGTSLFAQNFCGLKNISFKSGEKIVYNIYYHYGFMNVDGGIVTFTTTLEKWNKKDVFHLVGEGKTYPKYDWFYKVRDKYESYIDTSTLLPYQFIRNTSEDGEKKYNNILFYHNAGNALCGSKTVKTPACIQDVLSAIYYARNIDFNNYKVGDKIYFNMILDETVYPIYIKYTGKQKLKTKFGTYNTITFRPLLIKGTLFKGGENMQVWVTDDANKIPVRVESKILVGEVRADIIEYSNLRNPQSALIK